MERFALLEPEAPETIPEIEQSSPGQDSPQQLTPAVLGSNLSLLATTTSNRRLKPPLTPKCFWDTPVGRNLDGSLEVRRATGDGGNGGERDVVSRRKEALSGPTEQGAGNKEDGNSSPSTPVVDAGAGPGAGADAGIEGWQMTRAGEEEAHLNRRGSSLPTPPLPSPSERGGPVPSDVLDEVALVEDAHQDTTQESRAARGVGAEQVTAQGTGAKAVRSLSRGGGGGGGEGSIEIGADTPETAFESEDLLSGAHAANSCGEIRRRPGKHY